MKNNFDFYGFTVKYCMPSNIAGKFLRFAKIYYKDEHLCDFSLDKNTKEANVNYLNKEKKNKIIQILSDSLVEDRLLPKNLPSFLARMFEYLEMQHYLRKAEEMNIEGIISIQYPDGFCKHLLPVSSNGEKVLERVKKENKGYICTYLPKELRDEFVIENIFV